MITKKRVLITGGTGYLGSNIILSLHHMYEFILLKRRTSVICRIKEIIDKISSIDVEDLNQDIAENLNIDIILHCATHYGRRQNDTVNTIEANLLLPLRILSFFKNANKPVTFINTDTILDKNINAYSLSKNQFKDWMNFFESDQVFVNMRLEHFYGPADDKTKFVSYLIDALVKKVPSIELTLGNQYRYFTYIDDIILAFDIVLSKVEQFGIGVSELDVSNDTPIQLKEFVTLVKTILGNENTELKFGSIPYRKGELMHFTVDNSKIKELGWVPNIGLEAGLLKTIELDKKTN